MNYKINYNNNKSTQIEQAIKVLASWIGEADPKSNSSLNFLTIKNNSEEIKNLNLNKANILKKFDDFLIYRDKKDIQNTEKQIFILAIGDRGLANGVYHLYMKLKEQQTQDPFSINWNIFESPFFETRCMMVNICLMG
ncbi:MAG: hypothetical protein KAX18_05630 [Candidatus Lokiarchaeota archaeon]|nr:hypothetical protein [Candidatus Lokiarchaeota archaeon]